MNNLKVLALCAAVAVSATATAAEKLKVTSINITPKYTLIVGDSLMYYNCGMNAWLEGFVKKGVNPKYAARIATIGGSGSQIAPVAEYLNPLLNEAHAKAAPEKVLAAEKKALQRKYDTVLLQGQRFGERLAPRDEFYQARHAEAVRKYGATPIVVMGFMSKAKNKDGVVPVQIDEVVSTNIRLANKLNAYLIPVGIAFYNAEKQIPGLNLYMPDLRHPVGAGSFVMAATMYAALFKKHPAEVMDFNVPCEKVIPTELRKQLCDIAWKTCSDFYGWKK